MGIEAVTFDHWNTLVSESGEGARHQRAEAYLAELSAEGYERSAEQVDAALVHAWEVFTKAWADNEQFDAGDSVSSALEHLGADLGPEAWARLVERTVDTSGRELPLLPGVEACLRELRDAGIRLGIICDVGLTPSTALRANLEQHGVLELFDHWSFSDDVGAYKPSPAIFEHALDGLGVTDPGRAAHVGDLRRTDIAGARAVGMVSVRYTGAFDDPDDGAPDADHVLADHGLLGKALGITS